MIKGAFVYNVLNMRPDDRNQIDWECTFKSTRENTGSKVGFISDFVNFEHFI